MILTAHQPTFFPWLGTFHKILLADEFCFFDIAQYQKREWDNRNKILTNNGPTWITIPVLSSKHFDKKISEIEINNTLKWAGKIHKTIDLNYKKHPFYHEHKDFLSDYFLNKEWKYLCDLNMAFYHYIFELLKIDIPIKRATDYDFHGEKSDLVLDMCVKLGASTYIFGGEGENYADKESFEKNDIKLHFQKYNCAPYEQFGYKKDFESHLSILDLIMNYPTDELRERIMFENITKL